MERGTAWMAVRGTRKRAMWTSMGSVSSASRRGMIRAMGERGRPVESQLVHFQSERLKKDLRPLTGHSSKVEFALDGESLVTLGLKVFQHIGAVGVVAGPDEAFDKGASRGLNFPVDDHGLVSLVRKYHLSDLDPSLEFALSTEGCQLLQ